MAFASGETIAPLAHHGVQSVRQSLHHAAQPGAVDRVPDLLVRGVRSSQGQVSADGVVEQMSVLGDHAHRGVQRCGGDVTDVRAVVADGAGADVVQAGQQGRDGGLARPGGAHQGIGLAGPHREGDAVQHLLPTAPVQHRDLLE